MNYLALLGWGSPSGEEVLDRDRLISEFTIDRVHHAPAIFDTQKLDWLNQQYIQRLSAEEFVRRVVELYPDTPRDVLQKVAELELIQTRVSRLDEVPDAIRYLYERPQVAAGKWLGAEEASRTLEAAAARLESLDPWTTDAIKDAVQNTIEELGLHRRKGPKPIFVARLRAATTV
jgi:glutamyl/glutaminyl-tRNA synthetase